MRRTRRAVHAAKIELVLGAASQAGVSDAKGYARPDLGPLAENLGIFGADRRIARMAPKGTKKQGKGKGRAATNASAATQKEQARTTAETRDAAKKSTSGTVSKRAASRNRPRSQTIKLTARDIPPIPFEKDQQGRLHVGYSEEINELHRKAQHATEKGDALVARIENLNEEHFQTIIYTNQLVRELTGLAGRFVVYARRYTSDEAATIGTILDALSKALGSGHFDRISEPEGPYTWARRYKREQRHNEPFIHGWFVLFDPNVLPCEDRMGRSLSITTIAGGFWPLVDVVLICINLAKANGIGLGHEKLAANIGTAMAELFPAIDSLARQGSEDAVLRGDEIGKRIAGRLNGLFTDTTRSENAAVDIAEGYLSRK